MKTSDIITTVQEELDDDGTEFTTNMILRQLEKGAKFIAGDPAIKRRLFAETDVTITIASGTSEYMLPSNHNYSVDRVIWDAAGDDKELMPIHEEQLHDELYNQGSDVNYYTVRGEKILLAGTPGTGTTGKKLTVYYSKLPEAFTDLNVETIIGKKYPYLLTDYCVRKLTMRSPDLSQISKEARQDFLDGMEAARRELEDDGISSPQYADTPDDYSIG